MSITVKKSNGTTLVTIADQTIDTSSSTLSLVGRGAVGYGLAFAENFAHLLENFANNSAPNLPIAGQIWYDTSNGLLKYYDGTVWKPVGNTTVDVNGTRNAGNFSIVIVNGSDSWTITGILSEGKIIAVWSHNAIAYNKLPATVVIGGVTFTFAARFPNGLNAGLTIAVDPNNYTGGGSSGGSSVDAGALVHKGTDSGTANALTLTSITPSITALANLVILAVDRTQANTSASTLTVTFANSTTATAPIRRQDGTALQAGDLPAGRSFLSYDGSNFIVQTSINTSIANYVNSVNTTTTNYVNTVNNNTRSYINLLTTNGQNVTSAYTPNIVLSDMPNSNTPYVVQSVQITGATYADVDARVAIRVDSSSIVSVQAKVAIVGLPSPVYLGGQANNGIQLPFGLHTKWKGLDPTQTYTIQLITTKSQNVGPTLVLDADLEVYHNGN